MAKENPAIKPRQKLSLGFLILALIFAAIFLFGLYIAGIIDIPFFNNINLPFFDSSNSGTNAPQTTEPATTCPATSCETARGCCGEVHTSENVIAPGVGATSAETSVLVDESCKCPSDTTISRDKPRVWVPSGEGSIALKNCECNIYLNR